MRILITLVSIVALSPSCQNNVANEESPIADKTEGKKNNTVFIKMDSTGRIIEKWGNEKAIDNDLNFRYFYFYDNNGTLIAQNNYHFNDDNTACIIKDSNNHDGVKYYYDIDQGKRKLIKEEKYGPVYDSSGTKVVGRKLDYVYDYVLNKRTYPKD